jgi:3,4-dihydroxy 2-butanone 4-phosphate synthase/GTP cyclohydrolase II
MASEVKALRTASATAPALVTVEEAIAELRAGRMVVVVDDERRENEGDLVIAADFATPQAINFMAKEGRGLVCLALTPERCDQLGLEPMTGTNESRFETAFTVSIEAREGVTTGISAHDRARTVQSAIGPSAAPGDLVQPGHVFPLRSRPGGVLERTGHTEAAVDLATLAGLTPAGVICEVLNDDGSMARVADLERYCARHDLKLVSIADLVAYRRRAQPLVERVVETRMPTAYGDFQAVGYRSPQEGEHHVALAKGDVAGRADVLVHLHSACPTGDVFRSVRCDCAEQLEAAMAMIERDGRGVFVYLAPEGPGLALRHQPIGARGYAVAAQILRELGLRSGRLITDDPEAAAALERHGVLVTARVPFGTAPGATVDIARRRAQRRAAPSSPGLGLRSAAG